MNKILLTFSILSIAIFSSGPLLAQGADNMQQAETIKALVNAQQYTFVAQIAVPSNMPAQQLSSVFQVKISKDSVQASLPYYGKTNTMPSSLLDNGINFKVSNFKYSLNEKKKGGWNIKINIKDGGDVKQLTLAITALGYTTLGVTSENREFISFRGYIQ
ncbi:MAG: DUF4251 domain-containing protein [Bacteroidetes bacterium]|nr:DUF4251 domain-containing protein [Bacteroidota bacterium]MBS1972835.1 DUF4251 domain-containing protein [Bacteroidota bacterium]